MPSAPISQNEIQSIQTYQQLYSPLQSKPPLQQARSRPLGKIVTQIEMNDPESRKALKAVLDQQIKEKEMIKNIERANRFKKETEHVGFALSNSFSADNPRFIQTADNLSNPRSSIAAAGKLMLNKGVYRTNTSLM